jgi:dTDP-4-amino-4,6-dideoxygalactose transaminase
MIRMNDFDAEPPQLRCAELAAVERVLTSGRFILGKEVENFEQAWALFCGTHFCVGVGNGMEALEIGLRAIDIGPGDEVITTPMTAIATVLSIVRAGALPVLADIEPATALLDLDAVERCLSPRTRAVLLVHLYGQLGKMEDWQAFCRDKKIELLEDCAQAHGAVHNGQHAGSFGAWGAFSFYPTKNLGTKGDAGALVSNSTEIAERAKELRNYGTRGPYEHIVAGLNSRLDELHGAILSVRVNWLESFNARRREIAKKYFEEIANSKIELLARPVAPENHVYHLFVVRCAERDRLARFVEDEGIQTLVHYPLPAHRQKCCQSVGLDPHGLSHAELHARQCLSLPCHPQLSDDEVARVINSINRFA